MKNLTQTDTKEILVENANTMAEILPSITSDREYKIFQRTTAQRDYKALLDLFIARYGWTYENDEMTLTERKIAVLAEMGIEAVPAPWDNGSGHVFVNGKQF